MSKRHYKRIWYASNETSYPQVWARYRRLNPGRAAELFRRAILRAGLKIVRYEFAVIDVDDKKLRYYDVCAKLPNGDRILFDLEPIATDIVARRHEKERKILIAIQYEWPYLRVTPGPYDHMWAAIEVWKLKQMWNKSSRCFRSL